MQAVWWSIGCLLPEGCVAACVNEESLRFWAADILLIWPSRWTCGAAMKTAVWMVFEDWMHRGKLLYYLVKMQKPYFWPNFLHGVTATSGACCVLELPLSDWVEDQQWIWRVKLLQKKRWCSYNYFFVIIMTVLQYYCHCRSWWGTCNVVRVGKLLSHGIYCDLIYCIWLIYANWCWMIHMRWVWKLFYDCWCKHVDMLLNLWSCLRNQESPCKFWILRLIYCIYCIVTDIFCILKKLVYAHLKLALYTLAETVDLQGYCFSLCHIKFIIINYTNSCKDALFGI